MRRVVTGSHGGTFLGGIAGQITIALFPLHAASLVMMQRAVNRIATSGGIGKGKRIGERRGTRRQQRQQRRPGNQLTQNLPDSHEAYGECTTEGSPPTNHLVESHPAQKSAPKS